MQLFTSPSPRSYTPSVIPQDVPVYKVGEGKFYVDDELLDAGQVIAWEEEPSPDLVPMNNMAIQKMREYLAKLDEYGLEKANVDKKRYVPLLDRFEASLATNNQSTRRARILNSAEAEISVLGKKRGRPRVTKITDDEIHETTFVE